MTHPACDQIAYIAALPGEARALARLPALGRARRPDGSRVRLGGMGPERAEAAARAAIADGASALVSWGVAAALAPGLAAGDLLLADGVRSADGRLLAVDKTWRAAIAASLPMGLAAPGVTITEARDVIADPAAKHTLHAATGADALDMESAAIARVAAEHGAAFVAIRVVLDDANTGLPAAARVAMDAAGHLQPVALARSLVRAPLALHHQLRGLKQLAVAYRAARITLERVADALANAPADTPPA